MVCQSKVHICSETKPRVVNCGECTREIYRLIKGQDSTTEKATNFVSYRKLAGHVIYILNRALIKDNEPLKICVYCTAPLRDLRLLSAHISRIKLEEQSIFNAKLQDRILRVIN
jgi:hypothetical protein